MLGHSATVAYKGAERRCASRQSYRLNRSLECVECGELSRPKAPGWRGHRTDEPETDDVPEVVFYCPYCAIREFGAAGR
jgi:hypothetical protein